MTKLVTNRKVGSTNAYQLETHFIIYRLYGTLCSFVITTRLKNLSCDCYDTVKGPLCYCCSIVVWLLCDWCGTVVQLMCDCCVSFVQLYCNFHVTVVLLMRESNESNKWLPYDCPMTTMGCGLLCNNCFCWQFVDWQSSNHSEYNSLYIFTVRNT